MNIHKQSQYIISHPAFTEAIRKFNLGDQTDILILLTDIQFHCVDTQIKNSVKEYGSCKRMLSSDIKLKLQNICTPENLNIQLHMPIPFVPEPIDDCTIISLTDKITAIKKRVAKVLNPKQLVFPFPDFLQSAHG